MFVVNIKYPTASSKEVMSNKYLDFDGDLHLGFLLFSSETEAESKSKPGAPYFSGSSDETRNF